ncbi:MAG: lamin tail domain-containing protein [Candidatus Moraniibacteriota bacterium]
MERRLLFLVVTIFSLSFRVPIILADTPSSIILSEIQTAGDKSDDEFIELYNQEATSVDLSGLQLRRRTSGGTESSVKVFDKNSLIPGHGYFLWANTNGAFALSLADTKTSSSALADNNSIGLFTKSGASGVLIDSVAWGTGALFNPSTPTFSNPTINKSLTRNITTLAWSLSDKPIPTNSKGETKEDPPPIIYDSDVRINELLANPTGDEGDNEFIEFFNTSDKIVDLSNWTIKDTSSGKYIFPSNTKIQPKNFLVIYRMAFIFALNNSDETVSLLDPNGAEKDKVSYKAAKENISWNYTLSGWRGGTPTPNALNQPNNLPETSEKVPDEGYKGVEVNFNARGKDSDNDTLKYTWDFGDGHKSYKEVTTHTYEENGTYTVTLKTTDGKDDTEETFTIKIESMPRKDVRITSLFPNPSGSDTGNEWLLIENREKKSINLKDYSIAVGWKKLSNHPIREDFIIGPKKEAKLTREFSLFTLPNQKGKIELRAPDGKVLQNIKYKLDKPVAEDAVYHKEKGSGWKWENLPKQIPSAPQKEIIPIVPAPKPVSLPQKIESPEIAPPTKEDIPIEPVKKSDQISLEPNRPLPQDVLAYGMQIQIPDALALTIPEDEKAEMILVSIPQPSSLLAEESLLSKINSSLNDFLNTPR